MKWSDGSDGDGGGNDDDKNDNNDCKDNDDDNEDYGNNADDFDDRIKMNQMIGMAKNTKNRALYELLHNYLKHIEIGMLLCTTLMGDKSSHLNVLLHV